MFEPTDEQRSIIEGEGSAIVIAGPGRGKTATAIAAARSWLLRNPGPSRVLFTSFSNAAVRRIAAAAGVDHVGLERRLQFRTIHSLAMEILRDFGRFVGLRKPARAIDRTEEGIIAAERNWDAANEAAYQSALKCLAREEGRVAFELMVPLAFALLRASPTVRLAIGRRFPFIVVDEFQDTRPEQWEFLKLAGETSRVLALGDPDQMIYEHQHCAALQRVSDFQSWKGVKPTRFDGANFRCRVPAIVDFAESLLHGRLNVPTGTRGLQLFSAFPNQRRASLAAIWTAIRRHGGDDSTIAFIVPSGNTARQLAAELRQPPRTAAVPVPIHAHIERDEGDLDAFRLAACAAADWISTRQDTALKTLAVSLAVFSSAWSRKGASSGRIDAIIKRIRPGGRARSPLRAYLTDTVPEPFQTFADGLLSALEADSEFASGGAALRRHGLPSMMGVSIGQGSLFDGYRQIRAAAGLEGTTLSRAKTTIVSMYKSKGREFDFVVLVVEPRAHSTKATVDELRRLYYVSATRAAYSGGIWAGIPI